MGGGMSDWLPAVEREQGVPLCTSPEHSEDALALQFSAQSGDDLRYVNQWGKWLTWDGVRWKEDDTLAVYDRARTICRESGDIDRSRDHGRQALSQARTVAAVEHLVRL